MKTNLEMLLEFVAKASASHPAEKQAALASVVRKHYAANRSKVDSVMNASPVRAASAGFATLKGCDGFIAEMMSHR